MMKKLMNMLKSPDINEALREYDKLPHALLLETLTDEGAGTMFKKEI